MTRDDIDIMWQQALQDSVRDGEMFTRYHFAKLVEAHTRGQIFKPDWDNYRQGLIDGAVSEREACAVVCDELDIKDGVATWYSQAIRARGNK